MTLKIPLHVTQYWREEWHLSEAQIEALEHRFIADYRQRKHCGHVLEPPVRANEVKREQQRQRVLEMAEMNKRMPQKQVAAHYGLTQQRISQLFRQFGIKTIRHKKKR